MDNPDPTHFRYLYKHASLNHLLAAPSTSACAEDGDGLLVVLRQVATGTGQQPEPPLPIPSTEPQSAEDLEINMETRNVLAYVGGYLVRKTRLSCDGCKTALVKKSSMPLADTETFTALKSYTAISSSDVGSLLRPANDCDAFIVACYKQFKAHAESMLLETQICKRLVSCTVAMSETQRLAQPGGVEV